MADTCPAFGSGFDPNDSDCQACKEKYPGEYVACGEKTGEETEVMPEEELDLVAEEHEAEAEEDLEETESPDEVSDEVPDEMEEPDDAAIESIEAETSIKRGRPPLRQRAFISILLTGEPRSVSGFVDSMCQDEPSVSAKGNKSFVIQQLSVLMDIGVVTETDEGFVLDSEYVR